MIGQRKLKEQLNNIRLLEELPKSIIITGEKGMGKHEFANLIANKFLMQYEKIDYELSLDILNDMYNLSVIKFYMIDFDELMNNKRLERFENTLLKFIEEPPELAWIVILAEDVDLILETIRNRCQIFKLAPYSINELSQIADMNDRELDAETLSLLRTPGLIVSGVTKVQIEALTNLSMSIISNISKSTPANTLTLANLFIGENKQYDLDLFLTVFCRMLVTRYLQSNCDQKYFNAFTVTKDLQKDLKIMNVNEKNLLERYLLRLKNELQ